MTHTRAAMLSVFLVLFGGGSPSGHGPDGEQTGQTAHHIGRQVVSWDRTSPRWPPSTWTTT